MRPPNDLCQRWHGPLAPSATVASPRRAVAVAVDPRAPWAYAEEIAWANARGIDLSRELRAEHAAGVRIAAALAEQARQRRLRAIDRAIAERSDWLNDLHQLGQRAADRTRREHHDHRLNTAPYRDAERPWLRWRPVCVCGWAGPPTMIRRDAERRARQEREHIFRRLSQSVQHTRTVPPRDLQGRSAEQLGWAAHNERRRPSNPSGR